MTHVHCYRSHLHWQGSTAEGYEIYSRVHEVVLPPAEGALTLSSDPAFHGDRRLANPEQLLLAAVSSCQLLSFLAIAARSRIEVRAYEDDAEAVMPEDVMPMRITRITLRPRIIVASGVAAARVERVVKRAHEQCFVSNTLAAEVIVEPTINTASDKPVSDDA